MEPRSGLIFAGVHNGSVYASADSGETWESRSHGLTQPNVYCLGLAGTEQNIRLYAGTEPAHLFESDDLGNTWREITSLRQVPSVDRWTFPAPPHQGHVKNIAFDPLEVETIYACVEQGGLLRSINGGLSWEELHGFDVNLPFEMPEGSAPDDLHRILIRGSNPAWFYICGGFGLCRTQDRGKTWEHLTTPTMRIGYPDALLINPRHEERMYMAGAVNNPRFWRETHDADAKIARSRDAGESWEILSTGLPEHMRAHVPAMAIEVWDSSSALIAGTTDGDVFYSNDEGDSWARVCEVPPLSKAGHYIMLGTGAKAKSETKKRHR
jgi:photosystem II stability/assembly factor-like uncharacterized protein